MLRLGNRGQEGGGWSRDVFALCRCCEPLVMQSRTHEPQRAGQACQQVLGVSAA